MSSSTRDKLSRNLIFYFVLSLFFPEIGSNSIVVYSVTVEKAKAVKWSPNKCYEASKLHLTMSMAQLTYNMYLQLTYLNKF